MKNLQNPKIVTERTLLCVLKASHCLSPRWVPVYKYDQRLAIISIGFLAGRNEAIIWRGPKKTGMIQQFLSNVVWGELDYLIIDTPPGEFLVSITD